MHHHGPRGPRGHRPPPRHHHHHHHRPPMHFGGGHHHYHRRRGCLGCGCFTLLMAIGAPAALLLLLFL